jgi:transposase
MAEELTVISERVDDIPVLLAQQERMDIQPLMDKHFATHGNWQGVSLGWVAVGWLAHILSQADHRLNHAQPWVAKRLETLRGCTQQPVRALDFSDDRLGDVLRALSDDEQWDAFEGELNQCLLRVYDLGAERVRLDSTTVSGYWEVTADGLFQLGHSKGGQAGQPQVKVMLAALDPLGMPVATDVLSGNRADDPLYIPSITRVRESVGHRGLLYVGDCKMASLDTRAFVQAGGDFYLCPLPETQLSSETLETYLTPVWTEEQALTPVYREKTTGEQELVAEGYERTETLTAVVGGKTITWTERRLVIRSLKHAQAGERALRKRLTKAQRALASLNERGRGKKRFRELASLRQAAEAVLERHRVQGLLQLSYQEIAHERAVRRYGGRAATVRVEREVRVTVMADETAVEATVRRLGWRVYATNQPAQQLTLAHAVLAYRGQYTVERAFGRLKGRPLSVTPMYVQRDDHATGLIRLLSIGLRVLTLLEFTVRCRLEVEGAQLAGLYAGNPKRTTARPTAERLLEAFQEITLTVIQEPRRIRRHLTPLSDLQQRILALLDFSPRIYTRVGANSCKPP